MNNSNDLAPIALFVYNRLNHAKKTIEALKKNYLAPQSELYIFSDAPKNIDSKDSVEKVREYLKTINGFKSIIIIERKTNYGIEKSIITGVTDLINRYGKIIVLEDDLVSAPNFLSYMNEGLELYKNEEKVFSITGYSYTTNLNNSYKDSTYFLNLSSAWSWATWKDKWRYFNECTDDVKVLKKDRKVRKKFNFDDSYDFAGMLEEQVAKGSTTWDICWYWSTFKENGLTLYPQKALVKNIGFDGSGVHCGRSKEFDVVLDEKFDFIFTENIEENVYMRNKVVNELKKRRPTFFKRILYLIKSL